MKYRGKSYHAWLLSSAAATAIMWAGSASAEDAQFNIAPQPLASALNEFSVQSKQSVLFTTDLAAAKSSQGVNGQVEVADALSSLLAGTGLTYRRNGNTFLIVSASDPQSGSAAGDGAGTVEALIVTAQKREENIQDVPIAMSAFTQEALERSQVAGGPDLMTQVPNMTFTKTNFTGYSIQLRGIGTQAISATTDAAVAVAFNNTPFIRNRFFEQEFYDLERVEVLRGPQGTLYGRNATAGVVNVISAKPKFRYEAKLSGDLGNYNSSRIEGMVNVPLVEDKVALRLAGAWTKRDGYATNQITGNPIDGRDLWSTRLSLRFAPTDAIDANLIWEHFEEDDDRLRSGKQLCKTDEVTEVAGFTTTHYQTLPETGQPSPFAGVQGTFSQGCAPASLYAPESFQTPNGLALPYYSPLGILFLPVGLQDPYASRGQSRDLRVIESSVDPQYRAKADIAELQVGIDLTDGLTFASETAYSADSIFSMQDYNRFNTAQGAWLNQLGQGRNFRAGVITASPNGGIFCDPQIGCSDRLVALDLSTGVSRQFSQEFRLGSDFDGPFNFSFGANFLRYDTEDKYYVFINSFTLISTLGVRRSTPLTDYVAGVSDNSECLRAGPMPPEPNVPESLLGCTYIDPNPIGALNDQGHNYFLSKNPYKLISYAAFGEIYYNITEHMKITGGLRWTVDRKQAPLIPSWLFADDTAGHPVAEVIDQEWREPTGRLALDWKPQLDFTDETLIYASYAHGYKAGGANPPTYGKALYHDETAAIVIAESASHPKTFDPEFVDAFELGSKNTLFDGRLTVNLAGFYYDYKGYQISQIVDRSASNLNFDAEVWGVEVEADWRPLENLRLGFRSGYENTRVADGEKAIDLMDRTAGEEGWVLVRPFPGVPSNCIIPEWLYVGTGQGLNGNSGGNELKLIQVGGPGGGNLNACEMAYVFGHDPVTNLPYVANPTIWGQGGSQARPGYRGWDPTTAPNNGEGFDKDLSGNELPNAPHFTATLSADYTVPLPHDWLLSLHSDLYYQSEAWTRIFNMDGYDKLKAYTNLNLTAIFTNEEAGWKVMAYVKNVMDRDSITGAFLNSDDSALTTNVFLTEPRLYGVRVTKEWTGGSLLGSFGVRRDTNDPYPFTLELGGQVQRHDASLAPSSPSFINSFPATLDPRGDQGLDLDWGDGREIKLSYNSGGWRAMASARYGRTNGSDREYRAELGDSGCQALGIFGQLYAPGFCDTHPASLAQSTIWSSSEAFQREEYDVIDFMVGRDFSIGAGGQGTVSTLSLGLRYAHLDSTQGATMYGTPDWDIPSGNTLNPDFTPNPAIVATAHRYHHSSEADRAFEGAGLMVSWDGSSDLLGNAEAGHIGFDWSVAAGALFGKQTVSILGEEKTENLSGSYIGTVSPVLTTVTPVSINRSKSVTVPTAAINLGLSYSIDRMKVGAGYRWERYFDAIDGGFTEHQSEDRTIDGPYFKIAVGFGG